VQYIISEEQIEQGISALKTYQSTAAAISMLQGLLDQPDKKVNLFLRERAQLEQEWGELKKPTIKLIDAHQELNIENYYSDDVAILNKWAIEAVQRLRELDKPDCTLEMDFNAGTCYTGCGKAVDEVSDWNFCAFCGGAVKKAT
jgi:rRNA maturation endonuclease Nob1